MRFFVWMILAEEILAVDGSMWDLLYTVEMISTRTTGTDDHHLRDMTILALRTIVARTTEETRMLVIVEGEGFCLACTRHVIEAVAMILRALQHRLCTLITITVKVRDIAHTECADVQFNIIISQPLLVEGEITLTTRHYAISFLSRNSTDHTGVRARCTLLTLPLCFQLGMSNTAGMELAMTTTCTGDKQTTRLIQLPCHADTTNTIVHGRFGGLWRDC